MKKWTLLKYGKPSGNEATEHYNIKKEIAQVMLNRGIDSESDLGMFIDPDISKLRDPFLMKDMEKSCKRIERAIKNNEKICIYGDYDVDGVSSTSLLLLYFKSINYDVDYYIPNRLDEGYGLNEDAIKHIYTMNIDLIITVDCGITSVKEVDLANELGMDVIITDHHECQTQLPNAYSILNPKQPDCKYPFKGICGCGVSLKLIHGLSGDDFYNNIDRYIEIVSLATICDVMPVLDENRIIVKNGLKVLGSGANIGMKALMDVCELGDNKIKSSHLGFQIGPRINASGRLGFSNLGVELFTAEDEKKAREIAELMDIKNQERQLIEANMYREVEEEIIKNSYEDNKVIVVSGKNWHHGIIGIVASKITEKYYKPCILLCEEGEEAVGSARSIKGFDIFSAMLECKDLMTKFGGHEQAAGLTIRIENIEELRNKINSIADYKLEEEDLIEEIKIEYEIDEEAIDLELVKELHLLEPFGIKNPTPYFMMRNCYVDSVYRIGKEKNHIKMNIHKERGFQCIGFMMGHLLEKFNQGDYIDIVFQIDENTYMGNTTVQLLIKDIRVNRSNNYDFCMSMGMEMKKTFNLEHIDTKEGISSLKEQVEFMSEMGDCIKINLNDKNELERVDTILEYMDDGDLIIVNTIQGYLRAKSDLYTLQDKKIDLIFVSDIDKNVLKVYNKIIVYDFFDNISDIKKITDNKNASSKIILNMGSYDYIYLRNKFREILCSREEFVIAYKYLIGENKKELMNNSLNDDKIILRYKNEVDVIDFLRHCRVSIAKASMILEVFSMEGLIEYYLDFEKRKLYFTLLPKPKNKLNLEENSIIKYLNSIDI